MKNKEKVSSAGSGFGTQQRGGSLKNKGSKKNAAIQRLNSTYEKKKKNMSTSEMALETQKRIDRTLRSLPPHLQLATQLYQQICAWNANLSRMTVLQLSHLPPEQLDGAKRAQHELERLYEEYDLSDTDLHNVFQQITWDCSADAKAARSMTGVMSSETQACVDRAAKIIADAVESSGRCLDVGCGYGAIVPSLLHAGLLKNQIVGVDLSPEMIRNAELLHENVQFYAMDFLQSFHDESGFEGIIFCSSIHDFPDQTAALQKSSRLLRPGGALVLVHPRGASHVHKQHAANPLLVKRDLLTADELDALIDNSTLPDLTLVSRPVSMGSPQEVSSGYLSVLQKLKL